MRILSCLLFALMLASCVKVMDREIQTSTATAGSEQPALLESEFAAAIADGTLNSEVTRLLPEFNAFHGPDRDALLVGMRLFTLQSFQGNGRTCATCHSLISGTFTLAEARERYASNPQGPLFRAVDSDAGDGKSYSRLLRDGTVTVTIPLPPNVRLADDPSASTVTLLRGTPSFLNVAALDPILMHDGRAPDLQAQALDALRVHAKIGRTPTREELDAIAHMEKSRFTSVEMRQFAAGGSEPGLPEGSSAAEQRGRAFFVSQPVDVKNGHGVCATCHSGPMLDTTNEHLARFFPQVVPLPGTDLKFGADAGFRVFTNASAEHNSAGLPVRTWRLRGPDGSWEEFKSPDIGMALSPLAVGIPDRYKPYMQWPVFTKNIFKINSLRGIARTPPYFHDNSAKTLEAAVAHYDRFLREGFGFPGSQANIELSAQDRADIVAYMKLL